MNRRSPRTEMAAVESSSLHQILDRIQELPTLPEVITRVISVADDVETSAHDFGDLIAQDQGLTASVLKLVNSPYYGFSQQTRSIHEGVMLLGFRTIQNLALSAVLVKSFGEPSRDRRFDRKALWRHTVACALGARLLSRQVGREEPEEAYLAGLVHDMGIVILDQYVHEDFRRVIDRVSGGGVTLCEAEHDVLGSDHAEVGAFLARRWSFPSTVAEAIACHHEPGRATQAPALAALVHVADALARAPHVPEGRGDAADTSRPQPDLPWMIEPISEAALATLALDADGLDRFRHFFQEEWEQAQPLLRLLP